MNNPKAPSEFTTTYQNKPNSPFEAYYQHSTYDCSKSRIYFTWNPEKKVTFLFILKNNPELLISKI